MTTASSPAVSELSVGARSIGVIGVIGAGRVGAVLAAALRSAGYPIAAAAGESAASRTRIETLLPGVRIDKPTAVARSCDLLLLTVPDDALDNVVRMLVASGAIRAGQYVVHTSGLHGTEILRAGRRDRCARHRDAPGDDVHRHAMSTSSGSPACVYGVTCADAERPVAEELAEALRGSVMWVAEADRELYHAALAHGANHLVTLVSQAMQLLRAAGSADPAAVLRPLLSAALDNALRLRRRGAHRPDRPGRPQDRGGPSGAPSRPPRPRRSSRTS